MAQLSKLPQSKGEPLSFVTFKGILNDENTLSNLGVVDFIKVEFVISISTNLECLSIITSK